MTPRRPRIRPRFELQSPLAIGDIRARLADTLAGDEAVQGLLLERRIELVPDDDSHHFFSPQLTVDAEETDDGTTLRGRFGPAPHVWTFYVALHATGAMATLCAGIYGMSQHIAGESPWALWALPASPVLAVLVWALAFVGQGVASEQMFLLRRVLEEAALPEEEENEPILTGEG